MSLQESLVLLCWAPGWCCTWKEKLWRDRNHLVTLVLLSFAWAIHCRGYSPWPGWTSCLFGSISPVGNVSHFSMAYFLYVGLSFWALPSVSRTHLGPALGRDNHQGLCTRSSIWRREYVKLGHLVESLDVDIWFRDNNSRTGPGADGLLEDTIVGHLFQLLLNSSFWVAQSGWWRGHRVEGCPNYSPLCLPPAHPSGGGRYTSS